MKLHTQKLSIIESLLQLNDKNVLNEIETYLKSKLVSYDETKKPLTKKELINRAKQANKDIAAGKVISQSKLEKVSELW